MLNLFVISLGCSKNQVDTENMLGKLLPAGFVLIDNPNSADLLLVNTCAFIEPAREEAIDTILELVNIKSENQKLVVTGCLPQRYRSELEKEIPEVDLWLDISSEQNIIENIFPWFNNNLNSHFKHTDVRLTPEHYAYLRVADGCNHLCSFCAIPAIRGAYKSLPPDEILLYAEKLAEQNVKEINLIAQDTSSYGKDINTNLVQLLNSLCKIKNIKWIRLQYLYPATVNDELINLIAAEEKICSYFDIPLQHISDKILESMKRPNKKFTVNLLNKIKSKIPDAIIRTSMIVGYPNETDDEFNELFDFISEFKFNRLGVFKYSREQGTAAFDLGDPVPPDVKQKRFDLIMQQQQQISRSINNNFIGKSIDVIIDSINKNIAIARTMFDAPEVDGNVFIENAPALTPGDIVKTQICRADEYDLYAKI